MAQGKYGPVTPEKYNGQVGPNYNKYGERPGWIYNPWKDTYFPDPKAQEQYLTSQGLGPPKKPGLAETLVPVAATAGAIKGAEALGGEVIGEWGAKGAEGSGLLGGIKDTLGMGGSKAPAATQTASNIVAAQDMALDSLAGGGGPLSGGPPISNVTNPQVNDLFGAGGGADSTLVNTGSNALNIGLGAAGTGIGAYGAYQGIKNKDPLGAGMGGLGMGLGLNQLGFALGPVGWAAAIGAPVIAGLINKLGDKDRWKEEQDRKKKLIEQGILPPEALMGQELSGGRSIDQLIDIEKQKAAQGQWSNVDFAKSRNVADLKPEDIWGFSTPYETLGAGYGQASEDQRRRFNQQLLDEGLVTEGRGQIKYTDPERAKAIWGEVLGGN